jgi:hypothetical protein
MLRTPALEAPYGADGTRWYHVNMSVHAKSKQAAYLVQMIRRHRRSEHDRSLHALFDECARCTSR